MNRRNILAVAAMAVGLAALPAAAERTAGMHGAGKGGMHGRMFSHMSTALNLSEAQKATAKQLFEQTRTEAKPLMADMKQIRTDLEAAVKANNTGQIATLSARQGQLSGQLAELHSRAMAGFYAQLTPEQKAKADELKSSRQGWKHRRQGGGARSHQGAAQ